jgi:hypothetical protein
MIKRILLMTIVSILFYGQSVWAENKNLSLRTGHFFNVSAYVNTLSITTYTQNKTYSQAGIKILTPGYKVSNINNRTPNGYYLFSVSDKLSTDIILSGKPGTVSIKLCLDGLGSGVSCEIITIDLNKQKYAYVASGFNNVVYKCFVNADGSLNKCEPSPLTGAPAWTPEAITFTTVGGIQYAYIASWPDGMVYKCNLNAKGSLAQCIALTPTGLVYTHASGVSFATINNIQYAYVSDNIANVFQCSLTNDGSFNVCHPTPATDTPNWLTVSTTFNQVGGVQYAYVSSDNGNVFQCGVNGDGNFGICQITPSTAAPVWLPKSVTFATFENKQYAYVADDSGFVFQCRLNTNGTFKLCLPVPILGAPEWNPRAIAFATIAGVQYAYVADFGTGTTLVGAIYQCTLTADGKFSSCVPTPVLGMPNWGNLWWVAFN